MPIVHARGCLQREEMTNICGKMLLIIITFRLGDSSDHGD